jgi:2-phosphosulfolactate phosphatase
MQKTIEVILTPALANLVDFNQKNIVAIDIFRATTTLCSAFDKGFGKVITVGGKEEALQLKNHSSLTAGERDGQKLPGFDLGNSPLQLPVVKNKETLILTTTNGTQIINISLQNGCKEVISGSFINMEKVIEYLKKSDSDCILFCAGWKNQINIEDTFYAGALASALSENFKIVGDPAQIALNLWDKNCNQYKALFRNSNHYQRLSNMGCKDDIEFCMETSVSNALPVCSKKSDFPEFIDFAEH